MGRKGRARTSLAASHSSSVEKDDSAVIASDVIDPRIATLAESINRLTEQLAAEREARVRLEEKAEKVIQPNLKPAYTFESGAGEFHGTASSEFHLSSESRNFVPPFLPGAGNRKLYDLPMFLGHAEDWPLFETSFYQSTASFNYTEMENTFRLRKALLGEAKEAVESLLIHPDHVGEIMSILKFRFGRPEQMVRVQLQKVSEMPAISESRIELLIPFATRVRNLVAFLNTDSTKQHLTNPQLLEDLMFKLPISKRIEWAQVAVNIKPYPTLADFSGWLNRTADYIILITKPSVPSSSKNNVRNSKPILYASEETVKSEKKCHICCAGAHKPDECTQFASLSVQSRWTKCKQNKLCFSCLLPGHQTAKCRHRKACRVNNCERRHHQLLHDTVPSNNSPAVSPAVESHQNLVLNCRQECVEPTLMFRVLPVKLYGSFGAVDTYALLDEGSSVTLIEEELADQLKLDGASKKEILSLQWYGGKSEAEMSRRVALRISGIEPGQTIYAIDNVRTVKTLKLPSQSISMSALRQRYPALSELPLMEVKDKPPRIMIGLQHAHLGSAIRTIECPDGPIAVYTKLGWVVHGPYPAENSARKSVVLMCCQQNSGAEWKRVEKLVEDYFEIENLGVKNSIKPIESDANKRARELMSLTTVRDGNRFETGLLWKQPYSSLPDSREMALKRLAAVERKMERDENYGAAYRNIISDYIRKGYAKKLSKQEADVFGERTWYLPHFGVKNVNKPAKIRLVFDAAATANGVSLNSHLLKGPDLNQPLLSVLFGFRTGVVGVIGDIEEMFHQVQIARKDQDSQRFFWRDGDSSRPVDSYAMSVMIFGAACSPCSAQYVKNINADEMGKDDPDAVKAIQKHHYVDDYVASYETVDEAIRITQSVVKIHCQGGFHLRNFVSNEPRLLKAVGDSGPSDEKRLSGDVETDKVLGVRWNTSSDSFTFKLTFARVSDDIIMKTRRPTKREVLSVAMSVFDPFGLVANYSIYAKVQIQELWRQGLEWDAPLPDENYRKWLCWMEQLERCVNTSVPRCYSPFFRTTPERQLHIFADASETAFATAAYWQIRRPDGCYDVAFIMGKTRCAPRKLMSMPRLELQAAVLACRLYTNITTLHEVQIDKTTFWTDSKTVVQWIKADPRRYKPFVAHRIAEILEATNEREWEWIPSKYNVADDATRAEYPPKIVANGRWLYGPDFLRLPGPINFEIPKDEPSQCEEELRPKFVYLTYQLQPLMDFTRFSSYSKLRRTVAWILRFIAATRSKRLSDVRQIRELSARELEEADRQICRMVQIEEFTCEIALLRNEKPVDKSSSIFKLSPKLDDDGTLRMFGRIDAAACIPAETKRPILMPKHHYVTQLIVRHYHDLLKHQHLEAIVCAVRKKYWIPNLRALARKVKSTCQFCIIRSANPKPPRMGQHPIDRLTPYVRPFTFTGLDYFGPLFVTIGRRNEKRWVALFTCLTTRAVHLEIAADLSTDACLLCIRNFINIRGLPARIRSDNGTNFVGAAKEIGRLPSMIDKATIQQELSGRGIEWTFNSPANPEAGGCWERMVQSIKRVLAVTLKETAPQVETLRSLLLEAANIV